ncbi:hypothetical protein [Parasutterella excrementihominis]
MEKARISCQSRAGILAHLPNLPALHTEGGIAGAIFVLIVAFVLKYFRSQKTKA